MPDPKTGPIPAGPQQPAEPAAPNEVPAQTPAEAPAQIPTQTPEQNPGVQPAPGGDAPEQAPEEAPTAPSADEEQPEQPEQAPEEAPAISLAEDAQPEQPATLTGEPDSPVPFVPTTGMWIGLTAALAAAVAAEAAALFLTRRKRRRAALAPPLPLPRIGKVHEQGARENQQDCFSVSPPQLASTQGVLAVVADGMGGLQDGDRVSQTAVTAMMNGFYESQQEPETLLLSLLAGANGAVNALLGENGRNRSGSTLVAALVKDGRFYCLSVGDSRICLYRDGVLYHINREHVFKHELRLRAVNGEADLAQAQTHPRASGLTSYLGMGKLKYVDMPAAPIAIRPGDRFILMSDGVYNALTESELCAALAQDAEAAARQIRAEVQRKNYPDQDNYTAVILAFQSAGKELHHAANGNLHRPGRKAGK